MMTRRAFIIHGWEGYPGEGWFPWLKKEIVEHGKGHFSGSDGVTELPSALEAVLKYAQAR